MKTLNYKGIALFLFFVYFSILMLQITLKYIPLNSDVAFLRIKQTEVYSISAYLPIFYTHVYSAVFVLLAGFTQFSSTIQTRYKKLHKIAGYFYTGVVLLFAAPSGIFIGWFANGGIVAEISFVLLGILWFYFTLKAILLILKGDVQGHKKYMWRSFALTCSAITLRLWKVILVYLFHPAPMDVYLIIAWLGWIPNLWMVEWLMKRNYMQNS